ncbi:hypothetical protein L2E82_38570 [Cichorium intybus]|uniref:Uncharacterized protein n=1 Tax=Cichorium intybus TaxID=13427 RepID=A0ACB9AG59_CICIN|nr:hypothetical protein L2E82_38570 [Cichorium intybus]
MVSNLLGKDYASSSNNRTGVRESKVPVVITKVQALKAMPDVTKPSNTSEDVMAKVGTSYGASPSNNDLQEGKGGTNMKSYYDALADFGTHPPSGPKTCSEQTTHEKSREDERENVLKNESRKQKPGHPSEATANGDDYQNCRRTANLYWDSMKDKRRKAAVAREDGRLCDAVYYENEAEMFKEKAEAEDERASQDIFYLTNRRFKNKLKVDLCELDLAEGMRKLKFHLKFAVYERSLWQLKVIYGSDGTEASKRRQSVVDLLKGENIKWQEDNIDSLLITFDGLKRTLDFVECGSNGSTSSKSVSNIKQKECNAVEMVQASMLETKAQEARDWLNKFRIDIECGHTEFKNPFTIDLHGQRVKEAKNMLIHHLIFGVNLQSLWLLQVITGYGSNGKGKSKLKQSVVGLLTKKNFKCHEEKGNKGCLLITFDGQKRVELQGF